MSKSLLTAQDLTVQFGGLVAVDGFSLDLQENQLQGLIGPNGAGKTTVFNLLTGVYKPTRGTITLDGKEIAGLKHHRCLLYTSIPQGYRMHYAFCFGYPDETPPARPRDYDKVTYIG